MVIEGSPLISKIRQAQATYPNQNKVIKNWDIVTIPVDPLNPEVRSDVTINELFAINATTPNAEAAWEFVSYVTGEEYARANAKSQMFFPVRTKYIKDNEGHNMEAFYKLKPVVSHFDQELSKMPTDYFGKLHQMMLPEFKKAADGTQSIADTLDQIQMRGNRLIE